MNDKVVQSESVAENYAFVAMAKSEPTQTGSPMAVIFEATTVRLFEVNIELGMPR
jgi:hypothetical protein